MDHQHLFVDLVWDQRLQTDPVETGLCVVSYQTLRRTPGPECRCVRTGGPVDPTWFQMRGVSGWQHAWQSDMALPFRVAVPLSIPEAMGALVRRTRVAFGEDLYNLPASAFDEDTIRLELGSTIVAQAGEVERLIIDSVGIELFAHLDRWLAGYTGSPMADWCNPETCLDHFPALAARRAAESLSQMLPSAGSGQGPACRSRL